MLAYIIQYTQSLGDLNSKILKIVFPQSLPWDGTAHGDWIYQFRHSYGAMTLLGSDITFNSTKTQNNH